MIADKQNTAPPTSETTTVAAPVTPKTGAKTAAAKGRARGPAIRLENSDQLLGLLDGSAATTAQGKVTVNPKRAGKSAGGPGRAAFAPHQPNEPPSPRRERRSERPLAGRSND